MKLFTLLGLSAVCAAMTCSAEDAKANPYRAGLQSVSAVELPARAAQFVMDAKPAHRKDTTVNVVKAASELNPAATPAMVGAIARAVPDMAAEAAGVAATEQPKLAVSIARAAAGGAPAKAGRIVQAVCKAVPNQYRATAVAVAEVVPDSGREVLENVGVAIPELRAAIQAALAGFSNGSSSVGPALDSATMLTVARKSDNTSSGGGSVGSFVRGPAVGPPYIPLSGTPTNVNPGTGGDQPPGGRNYAAP